MSTVFSRETELDLVEHLCYGAFNINSIKKGFLTKRPFFRTLYFKDTFVKIKITLEIFIVKGLNNVFHACSMNHKQLMNMHLLNDEKTNSLQAVGN